MRARLLRPVAVATTALMLFCTCRAADYPSLASVPAARPSPEAIDVTLFLIGDAGAPARGFEPVFAALGKDLSIAPARSMVVFLGDNVYPSGLPDSATPNRADAERRLDAQIGLVLEHGARGIFLPGNHDWDGSGEGGWAAIKRQGRYVDEHGGALVEMLPKGGCPGPEVADLGQMVRLVLLDTEWWLHGGPKPQDPNSVCAADSKHEVVDSLRATLGTAGARLVVVLAHHPLDSGGRHGGYFGWQDHIFPLRDISPWLWVPLPIIGSVYPAARQFGITSQDMSSSAYREMRDSLLAAFTEHAPLVFAAGHEHNLQVLRGDGVPYVLVSGGGYYGNTTPVWMTQESLFAKAISGYMRVDFLSDGRVRLGVVAVDEAGGRTEAYSVWLN